MTEVYRPVQYLGSKLRVLPMIVSAVEQGGPGQTVWEPFTGSTVVAQQLATAGHRVVAADALAASATFATALLGVDRDQDFDESLTDLILKVSHEIAVPTRWNSWLAREADAIASGDGIALLRLHAELPQHWHNGSISSPDTLLSEVFAGTYFSLEQALRLERLRAAIDIVDLSSWARAAALTALCSAASQAVFSAGKHFAQPHKITSDKDLSFHAKRALSDRSVNIDKAFAQAAVDVNAAARPADERHRAHTGLVENATSDMLRDWGVTTVYADPPYTAQQYSRFYHVLETLVNGKRQRLQLVRGKVTTGLYPENRYMSPFCSRRLAPAAFQHLAQVAAGAGARLLVSYSGPRDAAAAAGAGNARSLSMDQLVECIAAAYPAGSTHVLHVPLNYRQFNNQATGNPRRGEAEYLIVGG